MSETRLDRLHQVSGILADRALAPVEKAAVDMHAIEQRVEALAHHRAALMRSASDPTLAGSMLAQAERLRQQQARALEELARARVALEQARQAAAKAVGRNRVLEKLIEKRALVIRKSGRAKR
ncbi:hypothetical protein [Hasllibacter sp. MH4015]|uniref:hypothetical protein n=1 Tax=Hasllibacter sp. MH4015 TaxID=2854029 RepID=UPI001CD80AE7|nr:hypothetical protein [Hasllibacter sp. MH4015]